MDVTLTADTGRMLGSRPSGRLRREGRVPGVVYGLGKDPVTLSVEWTELRQALITEAGLNALITLKVDGDEDLAIVKDIQRDPIKRDVTHVDFLRVDPNARIEVEVPLVIVGEPEELSREGGLVEQLLTRLLVSARVTGIPSELEVDITSLTVEEAIKVGSIPLPDGVTTDIDPEEPVVTGYIPRGLTAEEEGGGAEGEVAEGESAPAATGGEAEAAGAEGDDES